MKSDKKRSGREKIDREKSGRIKSTSEKSNTEKPDREENNREENNVEKSEPEKPDTEMPDAEKPDTEMPEKDKQGSDEAAVKGDAGNDGKECVLEEGCLESEAAAEDSSVMADKAAEAAGTENDSEKDNTAPAESRAPDDQEDEGEDWENDDLQDDWEEDAEPSKPWVIALVFLSMVFAAACICVMLWVFTHPDKEEGNQEVIAGVTAAPESGDALSPSQSASGTGNLPLENQGDNAVSGPNSDEANPPAQASNLNRITTQEGRVIIFTDCDDMVTPKEYVNLRTEPSTYQGDATVGCKLNHGETAHRTGISEEMGWSRVEYNDQILYVVTSFVTVVTDSQTTE